MCDRCPTTAETTTTADIDTAADALANGDIAAAVAALSGTTAETTAETTEATAPTCDCCGNDEAECECYDCEACSEKHNPADEPYCDGCAYDRRYPRYVCRVRCSGDCFHCENCDETHYGGRHTQCDNCGNCTTYHDCFWCRSCDSHADSGCSDCDCCESCGCECTPERGVDLADNPLRFHRGKPTPAFPSVRFVGAEIEVAKAERPSFGRTPPANVVVDRWSASVVEDGSLPDTGFEIKPAPASGDQFVEQIDELTAALARQNADVTAACGLHVHVNAQDFRWRDWSKLLVLYAFLEDAIYSLVPASRRSAHWCLKRASAIRDVYDGGIRLSWSDAGHKSRVIAVASCSSVRPTPPPCIERFGWMSDDDWRVRQAEHAELTAQYERELRAYADAMRTGALPGHDRRTLNRCKAVTRKRRPGNARPGGASGSRYYGLNLQAMFEHGTVEIRIHGGTVERDKIVAWGALWANIVDFAKKASLDEINDIANGVDPWGALMRIAPEHWRPYYTARRDKFR